MSNLMNPNSNGIFYLPKQQQLTNGNINDEELYSNIIKQQNSQKQLLNDNIITQQVQKQLFFKAKAMASNKFLPNIATRKPRNTAESETLQLLKARSKNILDKQPNSQHNRFHNSISPQKGGGFLSKNPPIKNIIFNMNSATLSASNINSAGIINPNIYYNESIQKNNQQQIKPNNSNQLILKQQLQPSQQSIVYNQGGSVSANGYGVGNMNNQQLSAGNMGNINGPNSKTVRQLQLSNNKIAFSLNHQIMQPACTISDNGGKNLQQIMLIAKKIPMQAILNGQYSTSNQQAYQQQQTYLHQQQFQIQQNIDDKLRISTAQPNRTNTQSGNFYDPQPDQLQSKQKQYYLNQLISQNNNNFKYNQKGEFEPRTVYQMSDFQIERMNQQQIIDKLMSQTIQQEEEMKEEDAEEDYIVKNNNNLNYAQLQYQMQKQDMLDSNNLMRKDEKMLYLQDKRRSYLNQQDQTYKYIVGVGNNGALVKRVLDTREWWSESVAHNSLYNLKWQETYFSFKYERLNGGISGVKQCVNHFEGHKEITTKNLLIKNLKIYCETNKINMFSITPVTFVIDLDDDACEVQITKFASFFIKNMPKSHQKPDNIKKAINDFKKHLKPIMNFINSDKVNQKSNQYSKPKMHNSFINGENYLWLLKPTGLNRGRGIQIFNSLETLEKYLFEQCEGVDQYQFNVNKKSNSNEDEPPSSTSTKEGSSQGGLTSLNGGPHGSSTVCENQKDGISKGEKEAYQMPKETPAQVSEKHQPQLYKIKNHNFVLQKYVERPLLINQRKFDIRVWVLVTHNLDLFFFKEGYCRTSSEAFNLDNIDDLFIHLTNNAVQQYAKGYGQFEQGNQISFAQFQNILNEQHMTHNFKEQSLPTIKEQCLISMNSVKKKLNPDERKYCIEIFGYDFMLDSDFNVWLIEVNTNPCLEESSNLLAQYIPRMVDDAFRLTLDVIFPPKYQKLKPRTDQQQNLLIQTNEVDQQINGGLSNSQIHQSNNNNINNQQQQNLNNNSNIMEGNHQNQATNNNNLQLQQSEIVSNQQTNQQPTLDNNSLQSPNNNCTTAQNQKLQQSPQKGQIKRPSQFPVKGYSDEENMWEFLGSLSTSVGTSLAQNKSKKQTQKK